nr:WRKY transcription factor [Panax notoginseng]
MGEAEETSQVTAPPRPTISLTLPPRPSMETLFDGGPGLSPGPMTLVSNFFSEYYPDSDSCSFSQLLAGAMASPVGRPNLLAGNSSKEMNSGDGSDKKMGFKQNRPMNLVVAQSPLFMMPPGLSPSGLLNSPGFFSPLQSPFGMSHQQALAHVTAQAALSQSYMHMQAENQPSTLPASAENLTQHPSSAPSSTVQQQIHAAKLEAESSKMELSEVLHSDKKSLPASLGTDKPGSDGYNWRKYGQKQVKASEYPRSYYKCTHLNCPVKKKVECSPSGQITEITYKGQHNHELPQSNKRTKDGGDRGRIVNVEEKLEPDLPGQMESSRLDERQLLGSAYHADDAKLGVYEEEDVEPIPKRRNIEVGVLESASSHKAVTEPRIVVQTRSEVDLLDDGFKWRKYGQKVVKGNPHPRSYYKCTYAGCNVRKHVERASTDPKAVITSYEGKHNHDIPTARNSGHNSTNTNVHQLKPTRKKPALDFGVDQRPVLLQLKEGQITA